MSLAARSVVCPFCALGCDDLTLGPSGEVDTRGCAKAADGFRRRPAAPPTAPPGTPATDIAAAVAILRDSRAPRIAGLSTDTDGMRAALRLAEITGAHLDHLHGQGLTANLGAMRAGGWVTATLAEIRNRADLVLLVGTDAVSLMPRFRDRVLHAPKTIAGIAAADRKLFQLGDGPAAEGFTLLDWPNERLHEAAALLKAALDHKHVTGSPTLEALAEAMRGARYPALIWATGPLGRHRGELMASSLSELLKSLNRKGRAVGLPLAAADNVIGANQVCTWQTGVPLPLDLASGLPDQDAHPAPSCDALLWITALGDHPPPAFAGPIIVLARPGLKLERQPDVLIEVGTPGIDHAGSAYRTDNVVALPLAKLRESTLPSVAEVLSAMGDALC